MWIQLHCIINTHGHVSAFEASTVSISASQTVYTQNEIQTGGKRLMDFLAFAINEIESDKM